MNVTVEEIRKISPHIKTSALIQARKIYQGLLEPDKYGTWDMFMATSGLYFAGYIDGKRAERAKRNKTKDVN